MSLMQKAASYLAYKLKEKTNGGEKEELIYKYVFEKAVNYLLFLIILIIILIAINNTTFTQTTLLTYIVMVSLRSNFGGLHVKSDYLCLAITIIMTILNGYIATFLNLDIKLIIINYAYSFIVIATNQVVDNENKKLSDKKKKYFKRRGWITLGLIILINVTFNNMIVNNSIFTALIINNINMLIGNKLKKNQQEDGK